MSTPSTDKAIKAAQCWLGSLGDIVPHFNHAGVTIAISGDDSEKAVLALENAFARDPALAMQLLRVANSPLFGLSRKLDSISKALTVVGIASAKSLLLYHCMLSSANLPANNTIANNIIARSVVAGFFSRALACAGNISSDSAFLAGLIHDIGQLVFLSNVKEEIQLIYEEHDTDACHVLERENALMGFSHLELGAVLAQQWNFPEQIVNAVQNHHTPAPDSAFNHAVAVGSLLAELSSAENLKLENVSEAVAKQCIAWGLGETPFDCLPMQTRRDVEGLYKVLNTIVSG